MILTTAQLCNTSWGVSQSSFRLFYHPGNVSNFGDFFVLFEKIRDVSKTIKMFTSVCMLIKMFTFVYMFTFV